MRQAGDGVFVMQTVFAIGENNAAVTRSIHRYSKDTYQGQ
jgi:hypothetical protein